MRGTGERKRVRAVVRESAVVATLVTLAAACGARGDLPDTRGAAAAIDSGAASTTPQATHDRADGAACAFDRQCRSGRCSGDVAAGACGVCLVVRALGQRCDERTDACRRSARCVAGVCTTRKKSTGDACALGPLREDAGDCDDDLACVAAPGAATGLCVPRLTEHAPCTLAGVRLDTARAPCGVGLFCDPHEAQCTARVPAADGEPCDAFGRGQSCADGLLCDLNRGVCHPPTLPLGARCGSGDGSGNECADGNVCGNLAYPQGGGGDVALTCLAPPPEGQPCIWQTCARGLYCASGDRYCSGCSVSHCERAHAAGAPCSNEFGFTVACLDGLECRSGTCRPACR